MSGLGAVPFEMDAWGVDVVVTGSQKAWMSAPGLAMIAASPRAWTAMESATMPRFYLDLRAHRDSHAAGQTPLTPAIAVVYQVDEGLRLMAEEGAASVFARHEACAAAARAGLTGARLRAVRRCKRIASKTVTAALVPDDLDWKAFNGEVKRRGVVLAGGQGKLTGKIFRLGHLGSVTVEDILGTPSARSNSHRSVPAARSVPARPWPPPRPRRVESYGARGAGCRPGLPGEDPGRRTRSPPRASSSSARGHEVDERPGLSRDELCAILPEYDALIVRSQVSVDAALIAAGTRLVVIGRAGVGIDNVDLDAATRAGITVVNAPTGNTIAAAEHTLALLLRARAADRSGRRVGPTRRVEAGPVHRARAARPDPGDRRARQDRPGHRGPGAGDGDDGHRRATRS